MTDTSPEPGTDLPLLGRLNRKGFRLVMLLDGLAVLGLAVGSMLYRFGWATQWPTYSIGAYALSFAVSTLIFIAAFYFGGLYEREPRLGGAAVLPRVARLSLAAGSFVALLNLALTGLAQQRGGATIKSKSLEIWTYDGQGRPLTDRVAVDARSHRGLKFIFADQMGNGEYQLIGSRGTSRF